jgi:hypothetical protein
MDTQDFLRAVLGAGGDYCLLAIKGTRKKQKFYPKIAQLSAAAQDFADDEFDAYFALATFEPGTDRKGHNVQQLGALFLDLDCGPSKDYPDQPTALRDLRRFVTELALPKPLMVNSGGGIHVYWPLEAPVSREAWLPVATALKRACVAHALHVDPNVTADAARVLRVPGTSNFKTGTARPVEVLGQGTTVRPSLESMARLLSAYAPKASALPSPSRLSVADDPVMQRLLGNKTNSFRQILERTLAGRGCAQLQHAIEHPQNTEEPLWRAALSIAKFCVEGAKAAHRISRGHPQYDSDETDEKLLRIAGPYTCKTFDGIRPGHCTSCPLWGKLTSPVQLGSTVTEADAEVVPAESEDPITPPTVVYAATPGPIPRYPFPYFRGKHGGVYVKGDDENPDDVLIYINDLYYTKRIVDPVDGECVLGRLHLPNDDVREFVVPLVAATSKEELRKVLAKHGVSVGPKKWEHMMSYTHSWIDSLQTTTTADTARTQFGWSDDEFSSYVIGDREIHPTHVGYNPPSTKTAFLFPALKPRGTLEGWVQQAKFYDRPGLEPYQFVVCQALAAPLMRFTPVHAAIFDFYSDGSGHGKSTTQKFALTIYGNPSELIVGPKDTLNARMNRLELMKDVNVQFDEFTEFPAQDTSDLIYGITDGRQKARMHSGANEERHRGSPWHTTVCASSNHSMLAKVYTVKASPKAEVQRVLRYHVQPHNFTDKRETDAFAKSVGENVGHAVEVFVQKVMADVSTVKALLETVQQRLDRACELTMQNRFWSVQGAAAITALILARDCGLLSYDPKTLFAWVVALINDNKAQDLDATVSVETLINDFISENYGGVLWIKSTDDLRGLHNRSGLDQLVVPEMQPRVKLVARYETDIRRLHIPTRPLKHWCAKQRLNYDSVEKAVIERLRGVKNKVRMGRGTKLDLPAVVALSMDFDYVGRSEGSDESVPG